MRTMVQRVLGRTTWGNTYLGFGAMNTPKEGRKVALATLRRALEGGSGLWIRVRRTGRICRTGEGYPARS